MYINFNPNTNFLTEKIFTVLLKLLIGQQKISYHWKMMNIKNIAKHKFILSPWGNGIDTHRFWESLYSGSIPITKDHYIYASFSSIPKLLVNEYSEITKNF